MPPAQLLYCRAGSRVQSNLKTRGLEITFATILPNMYDPIANEKYCLPTPAKLPLTTFTEFLVITQNRNRSRHRAAAGIRGSQGDGQLKASAECGRDSVTAQTRGINSRRMCVSRGESGAYQTSHRGIFHCIILKITPAHDFLKP